MADRRYLAQEITDSGQVEQLVRALGGREGMWAATFFSWLIPFLDDDGRIIGSPETLRAKILGRYPDLVTVAEVAEAIALMNDTELLVWYEVVGSPGERYLYSPRFTRHQTLRADRYGPSRHPAPPGWVPDQDHPYGKNPELRKGKPQRDPRRTVRVPKRPVAVHVAASPLPPLERDPDDPHDRVREAERLPAGVGTGARGPALGSGGRAPIGEAPAPIDHAKGGDMGFPHGLECGPGPWTHWHPTEDSVEPMNTGETGESATTAQPPGNHSATQWRQLGTKPLVTSRHVTSHHVTSPLAAAAAAESSAWARTAIAEDAKDGGARLAGMVAGGGITRDRLKAAILNDLTDLASRKDEDLVDDVGVHFKPGMYGDGRVRDRRGRIWRTSGELQDWAREEAERQTVELWQHAPAIESERDESAEPGIIRDDESGGDE